MRSPEHQQPPPHREGRNIDVELTLRYLSPGAFTVLPPDSEPPPDPPLAPIPHRLTPTSRRHKNQSFSIIAESSSHPTSRSSSPTGLVSPFRGRGFNPVGSRHASPIPSPPPESSSDQTSSPKHSKIPQMKRRGTTTLFGEKVTDHPTLTNTKQIQIQLSKSLSNISAGNPSNRPPPSPRRQDGYSKAPAFQRLSPIVGSSPEPSQSLSSPSRIPRSRSQPSSRLTSPTRNSSNTTSKAPSRIPSRPVSRVPSRNSSRDPSPSKIVTSPTRIPSKNFKNVQAKVNSFSRPKPKVPPKPSVYSDSESSEVTVTSKPRFNKRPVTNKLKATKNINNNTLNNIKNDNMKVNNKKPDLVKINNNDNNNPSSTKLGIKESLPDSNVASIDQIFANSDKTLRSDAHVESEIEQTMGATTVSTSEAASDSTDNEKGKPVNLVRMLEPSTTTVVTSTTTTVTQPLKIEAKIDVPMKTDLPKGISPMVDGRVLSATSVSNAINKMNDTVLDSSTYMKEHGLSKLSSSANTIISMTNEVTPNNPALDTKNATKALPTVENVTSEVKSTFGNHIMSTGLSDSKTVEMHVQNNMSKLILPDYGGVGNSVQKSVNDRIRDARNVIATDGMPIQPIRITVEEKPGDVEVQSGNMRIPVSATNGISERPSLPPPNNVSHDSNQETTKHEEKPKGRCQRILTNVKDKVLCKSCRKGSKPIPVLKHDAEADRPGCFSCNKNKRKSVRISIEDEDPKPTFWERIKCCGKNKITDTSGCLPIGRRKPSWVGRRDSILSDVPKQSDKCSKLCCKLFMRRLFCLNCCKSKKKIEEDAFSRRASTMSKKKSLTLTGPVEDHKPKLDLSLVEHTSHMKAAIPVLPACLAWFCLIMNCLFPGTGTILSGLFCLCIGKPRFSQKDGARPRIGAFIINLIIGFGQFFTVLFCLVGWGWSIWWGVIMVRLARKSRKVDAIAKAELDSIPRPVPAKQNHRPRDPELGS